MWCVNAPILGTSNQVDDWLSMSDPNDRMPPKSKVRCTSAEIDNGPMSLSDALQLPAVLAFFVLLVGALTTAFVELAIDTAILLV